MDDVTGKTPDQPPGGYWLRIVHTGGMLSEYWSSANPMSSAAQVMDRDNGLVRDGIRMVRPVVWNPAMFRDLGK